MQASALLDVLPPQQPLPFSRLKNGKDRLMLQIHKIPSGSSMDQLTRRWRAYVAIFLLTLICCHPVLALSPEKSFSQYVHNVFAEESGLPQNTVTSIVQ